MVDLEARLNAIADEPAIASEVEGHDEREQASLLEQFLADPDLQTLTSRSVSATENGDDSEVHMQYSRLTFAADQTRNILHLSFCPDLPATPDIEATLIDAAGRIRITHRTHFGVRLEISLAQPIAEPTVVCVETICSATAAKI